MRRRLFACGSILASALCAAGAGAADLAPRAAAPVFAPVPVFTWTGLYGGFNLGYAWSDDRARTAAFVPGGFQARVVDELGFERARLDGGGFTGGGQVGANYQLTPGSGVVVGFEADAQYTDLRARRGSSASFTQDFGGGFVFRNDLAAEARGRLNYLGTVRGRLGYAFDRVLVYGTGGFAYGETAYGSVVDQTSVCNCPGGPLTFQAVTVGARQGMQTGYAYGGGIEVALPTESPLNVFRAAAVTLKAEYLHYDLGTRSIVGSAVPIPSFGFTPQPVTLTRIKTEGNLARVGLNFKFGVD
ncbi:hypothetical protein ASG52_20135 [Methylobacterium sp. Leaf456]|uniref:outer membrane protein n=1 Tax=Methylobacterium sp. Leaf456 TaxID=1736382 RepID=UPI0006FABDA8|nr:porin family protein [Methylobacterium sp. Leaf456]KQT59698.1 hypothetical protein ASG52_20135 [Methylobacterium sp. Leaf456]